MRYFFFNSETFRKLNGLYLKNSSEWCISFMSEKKTAFDRCRIHPRPFDVVKPEVRRITLFLLRHDNLGRLIISIFNLCVLQNKS